MAARTISATIALDGERQFNNAMKDINSNLRVLKSELSATTSSFGTQANSLAALTAKNEQLSALYDQQKAKVQALEQAVKESAERYGENSQQTDRLKISYNQARVELDRLGQELQQNAQYMEEAKNSTDQCATSIDQYGNKVKDAAGKSQELGTEGKSAVIAIGEAFVSAQIVQKIAQIAENLASASREAAAFADEVLTLSAKTNISTDALQGYMYASELVDVSVETITKSMQRNIRSMGSAADGTAQYANAYKQLGVAVQDSNGNLRDSQDVFWELIDALGQMSNETERDEIAMTLLGKSAQDLNPLIEAGADRMRELAEEAASVGYIMSETTLQSLGALDDQLQRLDGAATAAKNAVGATFAPALEKLSAAATDALTAVTNFAQKNPDVVAGVSAATGVFAAGTIAVAGYAAAVKGLAAISTMLGGLGISLGPLAAGLAAVAVAIGGIVSYSAELNNVGKIETTDIEAANANLEQMKANLAELEGQDKTFWTDADWRVYDEARIAVANATEQVKELQAAEEAAATAAAEPAAQLETIMATFDEQAKTLMQTYQDTYNAAYESMSGQFGLFETAAAEVTLSTDQMIAAMMSQSEYMSTYSENLRLAAQYGITDGLVAALSDGSTQSAGYLQAIVAEIDAAGGAASEGGQKIIQGLNEAFSAQQQSLETYATGVADANTKIDEKMQELVDNTTAAVSDLDMSDEAKTSAENTLNGFVAGIDSGSGALLGRMTQLANDAIAAFNAGLEVKSPSRATKRSAAYTVQGFVDEIKAHEMEIKKTMQQLGQTAVNSFSVDLSAGSAAGRNRSGTNVSSRTTVNIYPQQMDEATIDYIYNRFNERAGAAVT